MIFGSLFRKAQATVETTVDNAIGLVVNRIIVTVPFVVATGFATSALHSWLLTRCQPAIADMAIAGLYVLAGLVAMVALNIRAPRQSPVEPEIAAERAAEEPSPETLSGADRELILAALSSFAPVVAPMVLRNLVRNLPLLLLLLAAAFVMTRSIGSEADPQAEANAQAPPPA